MPLSRTGFFSIMKNASLKTNVYTYIYTYWRKSSLKASSKVAENFIQAQTFERTSTTTTTKRYWKTKQQYDMDETKVHYLQCQFCNVKIWKTSNRTPPSQIRTPRPIK